MARIARIVAPKQPHLIVQESNFGVDAFPNTPAKKRYLALLEENAQKYKLDVYAYALVPNAVYMVAVPQTERGLSDALRRTHSTYGRELSGQSNSKAAIWSTRFDSCPMQKAWLYAAVKFVEQLPVRNGLHKRADTYPWSSAAINAGTKKSSVVKSWTSAAEQKAWAKWLQEPIEEWELEVLEHRCRRGYPLGDEKFLEKHYPS